MYNQQTWVVLGSVMSAFTVISVIVLVIVNHLLEREIKERIQELEARILNPADSGHSKLETTQDEPRKACLFMDSLKDTKIPIEYAEVLRVSVLGLERAKLVAMYPVYDTTGKLPTSYQRFLDMPTELLHSLLQLGNYDLGLKITEDEINVIEGILSDREVHAKEEEKQNEAL